MASDEKEEKIVEKGIDVEGPVLYAYCTFKVNGKQKIIHYFGDRHVNQSYCRGDEKIPLYTLIHNTIQHYKNKNETIDVFFERGFGSLESQFGSIDEYPYHKEDMSYIEYTYRRFEKDGCFHRPRDARCKKKYSNARFHSIDFRQTLHADILNFLKEFGIEFRLNDENEEIIEQMKEWYNLFEETKYKELDKLIQKNMTELKSMSSRQEQEAYIRSKNNEGKLYSIDELKKIQDDVETNLLRNVTAEYASLLQKNLGKMLIDYRETLQKMLEMLILITSSVGMSEKNKHLANWILYLFQNFLFGDANDLIDKLLFSNIPVILLQLRNINFFINFFKPIQNSTNFLGLLFYSIKKYDSIKNKPKVRPYYEYLLLHSAEKSDPDIKDALIKYLNDVQFKAMKIEPKNPSGREFMSYDYINRLLNSDLAIDGTALFLDIYTLIRIIKTSEISKVIEYIGAFHVFNQEALLKSLEKVGIITDLFFTKIVNAPKYPEVKKDDVFTADQCIKINLRKKGDIFFLPFELFDVSRGFVPGYTTTEHGSRPIARKMNKQRYSSDEFVSLGEYLQYKKMDEDQQQLYLDIRELVDKEMIENFIKGFVFAIKKFGMDRVSHVFSEIDSDTFIGIMATSDESSITEIMNPSFSFRRKRSKKSKKSIKRTKKSIKRAKK